MRFGIIKKTVLLVAIFSFNFICWDLYGQSRKEFVDKYCHIAVMEMERTGIPASIKLAQGILESGCGASELAKKANNHFGIKCHNWTGASVRHDDDAKGECFRKYKSAEESWYDHSEFLVNRPRYNSLFKLSSNDYKGWAKGLKECGYATNPRYAELLIKIIEDEELYLYDDKNYYRNYAQRSKKGGVKNSHPSDLVLTYSNYSAREEIRNGVTCIQAMSEDSFEAIAGYYGIKLKKLLAYNDKLDSKVIPGQYIYIKKKKNKAARGYDFHRVKPGDNFYMIAQEYGIKLKSLVKMNDIAPGSKLEVGDKINLRRKNSY